jgi:hypothetical protein
VICSRAAVECVTAHLLSISVRIRRFSAESIFPRPQVCPVPMKAISITAMIFAVAATFAVGWLTGSHAGYTAGAESEHVRINTRATLPEPAPPVEIVEPVRSSKPAPGTWRTIALPGVDGSDTEAAWTYSPSRYSGSAIITYPLSVGAPRRFFLFVDVDNNRFDRLDYSDAKNCAYISAISGDANSDTATSRARAPIA